MKFIFYINWWVGRACVRLLSSVIRALYHMFLRYCFYKSKILVLLQTLIKASNTTRNQKKLFLEHVKKVSYENWWVCQECSQLPSITIRLKSIIVRRSYFFFANHYFHPQITGVGPVHAEKNWIFSIFRTCENSFQ